MYFLHVWDKCLAAETGDGALDSILIPMDLAKLFFKLNPNTFPILSNLSFDDYDLFSDDQLTNLNDELNEFSSENNIFSEKIEEIKVKVIEAKESNMGVLFDPFR